jgi:hypothetical protein
MPRKTLPTRGACLPGPCLLRGRVVLPVAYCLLPTGEPQLLVLLPDMLGCQWVLLRELTFPMQEHN